MNSPPKEYIEATNVAAQSYRHDFNVGSIKALPAMTLDDNGTITSCNGACAEWLGCTAPEVSLHHISKFLPQIQEAMLLDEHHLNPQLRFLSRIGHHFQAVREDGTFFASKVFFVELGNKRDCFIRVIMRPVEVEAMDS